MVTMHPENQLEGQVHSVATCSYKVCCCEPALSQGKTDSSLQAELNSDVLGLLCVCVVAFQYVDQAILEFTELLLPLPFKFWGYR